MHFFRTRKICILLIFIFLITATGVDAHVTRIEIISRTDIQDGHAFGLAGAYEKIVGRVSVM